MTPGLMKVATRQTNEQDESSYMAKPNHTTKMPIHQQDSKYISVES
jgi:hypothetical protein